MYNLPRRKIRYWLYKFKREAQKGSMNVGDKVPPEGLKEHFEAEEMFTGWENFAVTWDLPHVNNGCNFLNCKCRSQVVPLKAVRIYKSVREEWEDIVRAETRVITLKPVSTKEE